MLGGFSIPDIFVDNSLLTPSPQHAHMGLETRGTEHGQDDTKPPLNATTLCANDKINTWVSNFMIFDYGDRETLPIHLQS